MDLVTFLGLPPHFALLAVESTEEMVTIYLQSLRLAASCPLCQHEATRIHSHYPRTVADLPGGARRVRLRLQVQKFFCDHPDCPRKVFVERLTSFVAPWARMTTRLNQALRTIGLATCGRLGARLAARLGMPVSWLTMVRRMLSDAAPAAATVLHLGIDDFAFRRGHNYGSLLVDLDTHTLLDLLPDRSAETATTWLQSHPEIVLVSRDRGGTYALAAQRALPHAQQVADRFHLVKNLADALEPIFARLWPTLPPPETLIIRDVPPPDPAYPPAPILNELPQPVRTEPAMPHRKTPRTPEVQARFAVRQQIFVQVMQLAAQGLSPEKIAAKFDMSGSGVRRWLRMGQPPGSQPRRRHPHMLDPYTGYLRQRWCQGCQEATILWQEIQAHGFRGSRRTVYRYVEILNAEHPRPPHMPPERPAEPPPLDFAFLLDYTYRDALWWFIRVPTKLSARLTRAVEALCWVSPALHPLYTLVQTFVSMVRTRCVEPFDAWLTAAHASEFPELQRFAQGLVRDYSAVRAGLTEIYSNGMVEGFVNKIKMVKRMMFGRAGVALLRQRVLCAL
ncbi:MAG: ISL3 family transposase [Ktedonobacterales bacterium]|nr:ISL3 family transposase [Ktedonobacterales bacterium]